MPLVSTKVHSFYKLFENCHNKIQQKPFDFLQGFLLFKEFASLNPEPTPSRLVAQEQKPSYYSIKCSSMLAFSSG